MKTNDNIILIYELYINHEKIVFYVCEGKKYIEVYMETDSNKKVKKLNIKNGQNVLENYLFSIADYCIYNWFPQEAKNKNEYFKCDFKINNNVYVFDIKSSKSEYNPFYECLNFIISHSKLGDAYKVRPKYKNDSFLIRVKALDNEIINFVEKYSTGRNYSFEKKLNEEWKKSGYDKKCNDFCKKLNNEQLLKVISNTVYLCMVGDCLKYFKPLNIDEILKNPKATKINLFFYLNSFIRYVKNLELTEHYENTILGKTKAYEQMQYLLKIMSKEELLFIFNCNIDWEGKINFINFLPNS